MSTNVWLEFNLDNYERLKNMVVPLLVQLIERENIEFLSVNGRVKTKESISEKIERKTYSDPTKQMTDILGVRVIAFMQKDVEEVCRIIESNFDIDKDNSLDRSEILGDDRIGYRSIHYVCSIGKRRGGLPEFSDIANLKFEIQVRTVLQHAWAELSHDRTYKFSGILPSKIQRKINLYSGMLEIVDNSFNEIVKELDKYKTKIESSENSVVSTIEIDSINVPSVLRAEFAGGLYKISDSLIRDEVIRELNDFGVRNLNEFRSIINESKSVLKDIDIKRSTTGAARDVMIINDIDKYFKKAWKKNWMAYTEGSIAVWASKYGPEKVSEIMEKYNINERKRI